MAKIKYKNSKGEFVDQNYSEVTSLTKRILIMPDEGSASGGYISKIKGEEYMDVICTERNGTESTYFCDYSQTSSKNTYAYSRSSYGDDTQGGVISLNSSQSSYSNYNTCSRLAFDGEITVIDDVATFKAITEFR